MWFSNRSRSLALAERLKYDKPSVNGFLPFGPDTNAPIAPYQAPIPPHAL